MLDYYGSIEKSNTDIDNELIHIFKSRADKLTIEKLLIDLRKEKVISMSYSVTGWNMFAKKQIYDIISYELDSMLCKNEKKLKTVYCLKSHLNPDILYNIFNQ
tara:strand:+ start:3198 stop:3506 length:309 start_codon:yes stop_codon:yes gene_type:complete